MTNKTDDHTKLSASEKRALLATLLRQKASGTKSTGPLSHGQSALWFLYQSAPSSAAYNTAFSVRIRSQLNTETLRAAFQTLVDRHASLRTTFTTRDGQPVRIVNARQELCFERHDAQAWTWNELCNRVADDYRRPFDLERGPLVRVSLFTRDDRDHVLLLAIHHIVCDAWSIWMLVHEFRLLYPPLLAGETVSLPPLEAQYSDYIEWQNKLLTGPAADQLWQYWEEQLSGAPHVLDLPTDRPRPPVQSVRGASHYVHLDADLVHRLEDLAKSQGATLYTCLLAAFQVLLHRYSGQDDILVGSPVVGRSRPDFAATVGYFANTLLARAKLSGNPRFDAFLNQVRHVVLDALSHQDLPFPLLVERLQPKRDPSRSPLVQVMFILQRPPQAKGLWDLIGPGSSSARVSWGGLDVEPFELAQMEGQFDLTLEMIQAGESLGGVFKYNTDLYEPATIARMEQHFRSLLSGIAVDPRQRISSLPLLTAAESREVVVEWNQTRRLHCETLCLHKLFEAQVERTPHAAAVTVPDGDGPDGIRALTYRELNFHANRLAHRLISLGVGPDVPVGICAERSCEMLVGLLGILKAGGAYVPFDPDYPRERLNLMLSDVETPVLLTQSYLAKRLFPQDELSNDDAPRIIYLDADWPEISQQPADNPPLTPLPHHLAYIIYTSGSTGRPKGAMNTHLGICNRLGWMQDMYGLNERDRVLHKTPISFDVSVWELFWPLMTGATVVMAKPGGHQDQAYLVDLIARQEITTLHFVPSMLSLFLDAPDLGRSRSLRRVICSGEVLPAELQQRFFARLDAELYNLYGPTEAAIDVTYWRCSADDARRSVPIGKPIDNTQIYILDRFFQPVPIGVPGEILIGGENLARGYLDRPALTAEKFVPNPFAANPGERLYRTGDLARFLSDGNIEYLERLDHQVKIRGCRVELGEIESTLSKHSKVREVVVTAEAFGESGLRLVAYLVPNSSQGPAVAELREYLNERLPEYMTPSAFVMLEALPLLPSGKVDRRALSALQTHRGDADESHVPPRSEGERTVAQIWRDVLRHEKVGIHDNFFELGGHSLLLGRVQSRLHEEFGQSLTMVEMFQHPTVCTLAKRLAEGKPQEPAAPRPTSRARPSRTGRDNIAIIGMAGRFPGADDVATFWRNLCEGVESIALFSEDELLSSGIEPDLVHNPNYVPARGVLSDVAGFDAAFFGYTPREAETMDVQHRAFLECAWSAIEDAGHNALTEEGGVGVFAGAAMSTYFLNNINPHRDLVRALGDYQVMIANDKDYLPTRTSYKLNLKGPSVSVQTACSTSLVAVHLAAQSLLNGECEMALAGGASIYVPQATGYLYTKDMILSPDGHCRAFDAQAQGTVGGSGVGVVVLKRLRDALADGDPIRAVIKGSAINNDGALKAGYTAPSVQGQANVIADAMQAGGVPTNSISYIEAHGTGTSMGDPIEISALQQAFRGQRTQHQRCAIGSVKSNIGHLDVAAGVTGLIKTALALEHGKLPPSLHFETPNHEIDFENSPFYVNTGLTDWPRNGGPRRAGVSSFGIGGTNAHVVLEEPPEQSSSNSRRPCQLLIQSAKSQPALDAATRNLGEFLQQHPQLNLADVAYTLAIGRAAFDYRRTLVCRSADHAAAVLCGREAGPIHTAEIESAERPVVFMFSGQGSQYVNMAAGLRHEPDFADIVDRCAELLVPHLGLDLRDVLYPEPERAEAAAEQLSRTAIAQPALFVIEYALANLWLSWGVQPQAMIGHSIGAYTAACLADVFCLEDALALVAERGRIMQQLPAGAMLVVLLSETDIQDYLSERLALAAVNSPTLCVVSGPCDEVNSLQRQLEQRRVECRQLHTSHAFHSPAFEPIVAPFAERVAKVALKSPTMPFISDVTGQWITADEATSPAYWAHHLRQTVRFADGLQTILQEPRKILLEVGPGHALASLARQCLTQTAETVVLNSTRHPQDAAQSDAPFLAACAGKLWAAGGRLDWSRYFAREQRRRIPLPTYPFQHQRYWIDPPGNSELNQAQRTARRQDVGDWFYLPSWQRGLPPGEQPQAGAHWLLFVDQCGLGAALARQLGAHGVHVTLVQAGSHFARQADGVYDLDPGRREDYDLLMRELRESDRIPQTIVHLWNFTAKREATRDLVVTSAARDLSFYSLIFLAQAMGEQDLTGSCDITVVSNNLHDVTGAEDLDPLKALLLGPVAVIPQEHSNLRCTSIDVDDLAAARQRARLVERLLAEAATRATDSVIAYRGDHRWVQTFVPSRLDAKSPRVRENGVYLITGGTGGVGLLLAEWLAGNASGAKLVLTARSELPPRDEWGKYLAESNGSLKRAAQTRVGHEVGFALSSASDHFTDVEAGLETGLDKWRAANVDNLQRTLDHMCALYVYQYFRQSGIDLRLGCSYSPDELTSKLRVLPKFQKFLAFQLDVLSEEGILAKQNGCLTVNKGPRQVEDADIASQEMREQFPDLAAIDDLLRHCTRHYAAALSGDIEAISVLYPEGRLDLLGAADVFAKTASQRGLYIEMLGEVVSHFVASSPGRKIRILEVGGGSGELTLALMSRLRGAPVDYCFTDIGKSFVIEAERKAATLGFDSLEVAVLDISRDPVAQAFEARSYDIIVGLDVVHATPRIAETLGNLKTLLGPGGLLCLLETVKAHRHTDMIWGLAEGWWFFEDHGLRPHSPLLGIPAWIDVLEQAGFPVVEAWPRGEDQRAAAESGLMIAQNAAAVPQNTDRRIPTFVEDEQQRLRDTISKVKRLEELGAEVLVLPADVSDREQMRAAVSLAVERFGNIRGVIHAAGIPGGGTIRIRTRDDVEREFAAKVSGSLVLDEVLADQQLDFFVLCSSQTSALGGFGQVAYSAASAFQDAFADHLASRGASDARIVAIDWDRWQNVGMAVNVETLHRELTGHDLPGGMLAAEGADVFGRILSSRVPSRVVVSTQDFGFAVRQSRTFQLGQFERQLPRLKPHARPPLANDYVSPSTDTEQLIAQLWQEELGIDRVGVHDDFFALGGDSLIAIKLISQLRESLDTPLNVRVLYEGPTVAALSQHIAAVQWAAQAESHEFADEEEEGVL